MMLHGDNGSAVRFLRERKTKISPLRTVTLSQDFFFLKKQRGPTVIVSIRPKSRCGLRPCRDGRTKKTSIRYVHSSSLETRQSLVLQKKKARTNWRARRPKTWKRRARPHSPPKKKALKRKFDEQYYDDPEGNEMYFSDEKKDEPTRNRAESSRIRGRRWRSAYAGGGRATDQGCMSGLKSPPFCAR